MEGGSRSGPKPRPDKALQGEISSQSQYEVTIGYEASADHRAIIGRPWPFPPTSSPTGSRRGAATWRPSKKHHGAGPNGIASAFYPL